MSMLQASIRKTGPLGAKIERIRAERIAAGVIGKPEAKPPVPATIPVQNPPPRVWNGEAWRTRPSVQAIQWAVAYEFGMPVGDMLARRRNAEVLIPRCIAMHLARQLTINSLPEIGRRFGGRDHTTVMSALRKIEKRLSQDADLRLRVDIIRASIIGGVDPMNYWGA